MAAEATGERIDPADKLKLIKAEEEAIAREKAEEAADKKEKETKAKEKKETTEPSAENVIKEVV